MSRRPHVPLVHGRLDTQGRRVCCHCAAPVPTGRRDWCGDECVERYLIARGDQNAARRYLWVRERGVCQSCHMNTVTRQDELDELARWDAKPANGTHRWPRGQWEADHKVPIAEGGALVGANLRTLCRPCHRCETAALRKRMAASRRIAQ